MVDITSLFGSLFFFVMAVLALTIPIVGALILFSMVRFIRRAVS